MDAMNAQPNARRQDLEIFWGEMHPCEHFVQIYGDDHVFLDGLASFVMGALRDEREAAIVITTEAHREGLDKRLRAHGIDRRRRTAKAGTCAGTPKRPWPNSW
jgi:hypothetical protein